MRRIARTIGFSIVAMMAMVWSHQALAQQVPNLVGTWKASAKAVSFGTNPYRKQEGTGPYFSKEILEFTFKITDQQDARFAGTLSAGKRTETLIGALRPPNFSEGIFIDDDGHYLLTVRDASTIDLCYYHINPKSKVVACYTLTKQ